MAWNPGTTGADPALEAQEETLRDILPELKAWLADGKQITLATVVATWGSAPRAVGSKMAVTVDGGMVGSVSGGCVEGAVVEAALEVLTTGVPRLLHFGVADDVAWSAGLACGGELDVFVEPLSKVMGESANLLQAVEEALVRHEMVARATVIGGAEGRLGASMMVTEAGKAEGSLGADLDVEVGRDAVGSMRDRQSTIRIYPVETGELHVFIEVMLPPATLIIVGAVHIGIELCKQAKLLGYRVIVVDPRRAFNTEERFPQADDRVLLWPDEGLRSIGIDSGTAVAVLSHDPKLDDPALRVALRSPAFFIGALGSKATDRLRRGRLREAGLSEEELDRFYAPIGLDLGGRAPEEIALSVMAEITAVRYRSALAPETGKKPGRLRASRARLGRRFS